MMINPIIAQFAVQYLKNLKLLKELINIILKNTLKNMKNMKIRNISKFLCL